jgi:hypothetical protein
VEKHGADRAPQSMLAARTRQQHHQLINTQHEVVDTQSTSTGRSAKLGSERADKEFVAPGVFSLLYVRIRLPLAPGS